MIQHNYQNNNWLQKNRPKNHGIKIPHHILPTPKSLVNMIATRQSYNDNAWMNKSRSTGRNGIAGRSMGGHTG